MNASTSTDTTTDSTDLDLADQPEVPTASEFASKDEYDKGTWQHTIQQSSVLFKRSGDAKKRASVLLWQGSTLAIAEWESDSDSDVNGEGLATGLLILMGTSRKGDVSKIKTVALAVKNNGLNTGAWPNLSKAYGEAIRLTKTARVEATEDSAGDEAVAAIATEAPKTATTVEGAIKMGLALAGDFDEFFRVLLDVVNNGGDENLGAHRAALRSLAQEVSGRSKPAPKPVDPDAVKAGASSAKTGAKAPAAKRAPAKAKPKATKATPVSLSKGDPNAKALPPKPAPVEADIFSEVDAETPAPVKAKPAPVKARRA